MRNIKGWSRCDWGTWALPVYITHLSYNGWGNASREAVNRNHVMSFRILCFGFFVEWSM